MPVNVSPGLTLYLTIGVAVGLGIVGVIVAVAAVVAVAGIEVRVAVADGVNVKGIDVGNAVRVGARVVDVGKTTGAEVELDMRHATTAPTIINTRITTPTTIHAIGGILFSSPRCGAARLTRRNRQASLLRGGCAFGVNCEFNQSPFCSSAQFRVARRLKSSLRTNRSPTTGDYYTPNSIF